MNMTRKPTVTQLRTLLAKADDFAGHPILWVDKKGEVHLSLVPDQATPRGWSEHYGDRLQFLMVGFLHGAPGGRWTGRQRLVAVPLRCRRRYCPRRVSAAPTCFSTLPVAFSVTPAISRSICPVSFPATSLTRPLASWKLPSTLSFIPFFNVMLLMPGPAGR